MLKFAEKGVTNFVVMTIRDADTMLDFYKNTLGLETVFTNEEIWKQ